MDKLNLKILLISSLFLISSLILIMLIRSIYEPGKSLEFDFDSKIAKEYLGNRGYRVISYSGSSERVLTPEIIFREENDFWGLQGIDPFSIVNQNIKYLKFEIKNHRFDSLLYQMRYFSLKELRIKHKGTTKVIITMLGNKVLGGTSIPNTVETYYGGSYSIDGKELVEITGIKYAGWSKMWEKKRNDYYKIN